MWYDRPSWSVLATFDLFSVDDDCRTLTPIDLGAVGIEYKGVRFGIEYVDVRLVLGR
jgi:hypothetical protein